jgi:uncharacterized glyoxalase superfamily protein PhnB
MSDEDKKKIMHADITAPNGVKLMGSDHVDFMGESFAAGNNFSLSLHLKAKNRQMNYLTTYRLEAP